LYRAVVDPGGAGCGARVAVWCWWAVTRSTPSSKWVVIVRSVTRRIACGMLSGITIDTNGTAMATKQAIKKWQEATAKATAKAKAAQKVRENRLRRMAARQGLALSKSRRRDPRALDFETYWLTGPPVGMPDYDDVLHLGGVYGASLDDVETHLLGTGGV
jgi:hypothetical protein